MPSMSTPDPLPSKHYNRPGLRSLMYRVDTHASFLQRMFSQLARRMSSQLSKDPLSNILKTRSEDDTGIALLDAWAIVADVFTFYQERIVNEGFLRTSTERRSVLELARAIGYELHPGVAASAFVAFKVEEPETFKKTRVVTVPKGTKIQSIPQQGQMPQTFETSSEFTASYEWNALRPRLTKSCIPGVGMEKLISSSNTFTSNQPHAPKIGVHDWAVFGQVLTAQGMPVSNRRVRVFDRDRKYDDLLGDTQTDAAGNFAVIYHERDFSETNENLPELYVMVEDTDGKILYSSRNQVRYRPGRSEFFGIILTGQPVENKVKSDLYRGPLYLAGTSVKLKPADLLLLIYTQPAGQIGIPARIQNVMVDREHGHTRVELITEFPIPENINPEQFNVLAFRTHLGFFGCHAPNYKSLPDGAVFKNNPYPYDWDANGWEVWKDPNTNNYHADADIYMERDVSGIINGDWLVIQTTSGHMRVYRTTSIFEASRHGFGLSTKVSGLKLAGQGGVGLENNYVDKPIDFKIRDSIVYLQGEMLQLAEMPIEEPLGKGVTSLMLDQNQEVSTLQAEQLVVLSGERQDIPGEISQEVLTLDGPAIYTGSFPILNFHKPLQYSYILNTVRINANVIRATHGETMREVLGSGDGSKINQRFTLKRLPLTYVSAPTADGAQSTLEVRANNVLWDEVPSLHGLTSGKKAYEIKIEDDGTTSVMFGDGKSGARLPSGQENVHATYRTGIGPNGEVDANTLSLLQTRPQGIRSVTNPLPASGAAAPDGIEQARVKAPLRVLAMDRLVSLKDYEYFAGTFAGIGKVQAVALRNGKTRLAHLTIAGIDGDDIAINSNLYRSLLKAIHSHRDPLQPVWIDSYQRRFFDLIAKVSIDSQYQVEFVLEAIRLELVRTFSFEQRTFGQPVTAAEVITLIQRMPGVIAVDLDHLDFTELPKNPPSPPQPILQVRMGIWDANAKQSRPAELLTINPNGISLQRMAL